MKSAIKEGNVVRQLAKEYGVGLADSELLQRAGRDSPAFRNVRGVWVIHDDSTRLWAFLEAVESVLPESQPE